MSRVLVEMKDVTVAFKKGANILENISLEVREGELISLIGPNGAGKSTLLKAMIGLVVPNNGVVKRFTDNVFYVPQSKDLDGSFPMSVREFATLYGQKGFENYLKEMGVLEKIDERIGSLSGGEYQRVIMAIALSRKAELLLLDEPTSGIDIIGEQTFYRLITDIHLKYGISMIVVSHNIHMVMQNTNKVMCLAHGGCHVGKPTHIKSNAAFKDVFGDHLIPYIHEHEHTA
ncbi:zinc ABC transporter ATP-binding protein [Candidatus Peregrinibacteria bacterium HGW-Peregrinibacteria-1]|jgi:zinc transport system ATP-binding protein|nr:MAG: zinc ABC transporter ATP-binding protein [Candidatus Peregrinibacteria bacterium HGW-Peregrinibacteria-1]